MKSHPGGKFVLGRCIGLDISKYFFGGYEIEAKTVHNHSYYAKQIVNELAIAIFESDIPVAEVEAE